MFRFTTPLRKAAAGLLILAICACNISWTGTIVHSSALNYDLYAADTIPEKPQTLDDLIRQIEKAQQNLQKQLSEKDWNKIEAEMENAINRINTQEVDQQMQKAKAELSRSMANLDKEQQLRNLDLEKEFSKKDWEKEMKKSMEAASADMAREHDNMAREFEKMKKEMSGNKLRIRESLDEARKELDKTRKIFNGYKTMINEMQKEGLIKNPKNYRIEYNKGELKIDGKTQPAKVTDRYRKYFHNEPVLLKNENDRFQTDEEEEFTRSRPLTGEQGDRVPA